MQPTIGDGLNSEMKLHTEESFAPLVAIMRFDTVPTVHDEAQMPFGGVRHRRIQNPHHSSCSRRPSLVHTAAGLVMTSSPASKSVWLIEQKTRRINNYGCCRNKPAPVANYHLPTS
ncbi:MULTISPECIES: hypothetical protein [Paraburkholderia]|uniref:hypothetical protein n=1 Tax=Paraburkholderia TaxID=1822464 RepID=UPI0038B8A08B